jgi:hypothetical protein
MGRAGRKRARLEMSKELWILLLAATGRDAGTDQAVAEEEHARGFGNRVVAKQAISGRR